MFSWATSKLESLAQTVAPPPDDPNNKLVYCCQRGDEQGAIQCLQNPQDGSMQIDPVHTVVVQTKGHTPLHLACLHSMPKMLDLILSYNQMGDGIWQVQDSEGNTPLHCACMSNKPNALDMIKKILMHRANEKSTPGSNPSPVVVALNTPLVGAKNFAGATPYDVATLNSVRQYLLPIQLQAETQAAIDNGGVGLPPGIDMGGLKIQNSHLPPPPTSMQAGSIGGAPTSRYAVPPMPGQEQQQQQQQQNMYQHSSTPQQQPPFQQQHQQQQVQQPFQPSSHQQPFQPPSQQQPPAGPMTSVSPNSQQQDQQQPQQASPAPASRPQEAPKSSDSGYALVGRSSAAIYSRPGSRIQPDGFHSSSSDKNLQAKYGHSNSFQGRVVPPPPSSGNVSLGNLSGAGSDDPHAQSAPSSMNAPNPFAGGAGAFGGRRPPANRYVSYDPIRGTSLPPPPPAAASIGAQAGGYGAAAPVPSFNVFTPNNSAASSFNNPGAQPQQQAPQLNSFGMAPLPPPPAVGSRTASLTSQFSGSVNSNPPPFSSPNQQRFLQPTPANTPVTPAQINNFSRPAQQASPVQPYQNPAAANSPQIQKPPSSGNAADIFGSPHKAPGSGSADILGSLKPASQTPSPAPQIAKPPSSGNAAEIFSTPSPLKQPQSSPLQLHKPPGSGNAADVFGASTSSKPTIPAAPKSGDAVDVFASPPGGSTAYAAPDPIPVAPVSVASTPANESQSAAVTPFSPPAASSPFAAEPNQPRLGGLQRTKSGDDAASVFGLAPPAIPSQTPNMRSQSTGSNPSNVFSRPAGGTSATDVFSARSESAPKIDGNIVSEAAAEDDEGMMDEIPLTPYPPEKKELIPNESAQQQSQGSSQSGSGSGLIPPPSLGLES